MNEQEFDALIAKIEASIGGTIDSKLRAEFKKLDPMVLKAIDTDSTVLNQKVTGLESANKKLLDAQKAQGIEIEKLTEKLKDGSDSTKSFSEQINEMLTNNKGKLEAMKNGESKTNIRMATKAVGDMMISTNVTGQIPQAEREAGITRVVRRNPFILSLISQGSISSNLWEWVQQVNPEGDAAMTAEGVKKSQVDFDLVLASASVKKVTAFIKVSKEMLDDVPLMEAEINQELRELITLKIDAQLLTGDGIGQNLTGIMANATAFNPGSFAGTVDEANNQDVLRVALNQLNLAQFQGSHIVMHPSDAAAMDLQKASDGHYIMPPYTSSANTIVKGVPIVTNTGVTEGTYLVGDFSKSAMRWREGLVFDIGYENDDFTKNFVTILAEARLVHRVKSNHYPAFVTGTFATDKAALETA